MIDYCQVVNEKFEESRFWDKSIDPFPGNNRKMYTFTNRCHEQEGLELGDETVKIFLNTKGTVGEVDEDIDKFLAYVDGKAAEGEFTQDIAAEVERIK